MWRHFGSTFVVVLNPQLFLSGFKNYPFYTLSDSLRIDYFPLWRADSKISGFAGCVRGRKPYPERKSCGFKNIRIRVDLALVLLRNRGTVTNIKEHVTSRDFALFIRIFFWSLVANLRKCQKKALQ